ncbi:hypothetical protein JCM10213_007675 [Rhodosporidiobolus nylandii]
MPKTATATASPIKKSSSSRQLKERQPTIFADDDDSASTSGAQGEGSKMGWAELQALAEDYELEAASHLRLLSTSLQSRLSTLQRHWDDALSSLDIRVRDLSLGRFAGEFGCDPDEALRTVVQEGMRPVEMGEGERGARKRKRNLPTSPRASGEEDPFAPPPTASKKQRSNAPTSASAKKAAPGTTGKKLAPGSARRTAAAAAREGSPTSSRKQPRLRVRPSQSSNPLAASTSASAAANFVYRASTSVLPTPHRTSSRTAASTVRRPKRGESIVMRSINGSPLGEFVASDVEDGAGGGVDGAEESGDEEEDEGEEGEEWDLMDRQEASRTERNTLPRSPSKSSAKLVKPPPRSTSSSTVPAAATFAPALPGGVEGAEAKYAGLKEAFIRKMVRELEAAGVPVGDRERVAEALRREG